MSIDILMPALSPTMEEGTLAKWHVKKGDTVKSGDVIAEIETDKATMEVEAVDEGTLAKIVVAEGTQDVPVNDVIAVLAGDGEEALLMIDERLPDLIVLDWMLPKVSGTWGSGRLMAGTVFSVLLTDDGRVVAGAVTPEGLYAALAGS